ncbi:HlyD family efflux transporter periplasmic adaptor subunit [Sulfurimonas aquatica]|uniref:HlyD family efflux transporter periplasmic adaptor subunit n=1 Tax=Sulfurimonas aquatica TaxID=2672570 RepID=A0A975AZX9_9BACT|nr:HlyD family secretion protein [Sulfurimonas aquatica]QSZ41580.1 HlyD family efflux transporter periplasmic adaptor subunit [Sulfurimonas aquatica]
MKLFILILLTTSALFSNVYYSKVEPYEIRNISSNVTGVVRSVKEHLLGKKLSSRTYIEIDSELDTEELNAIKNKIGYLKSTLNSNESILKNLDESLVRKRDNYAKVKELKIKSSVEKDREFYDLINSENSYLSTLKEINSLKIQISDLELRRAQLQRSIKDKNLVAQGYTLYSLNVKVGQVVTPSTPLATVVDTSKAILTIYLNQEDVLSARKTTIYIDGEKTDYKIDRLLSIADSKNISKYMAQIVVKSPRLFSKLVKVELKSK